LVEALEVALPDEAVAAAIEAIGNWERAATRPAAGRVQVRLSGAQSRTLIR
jgi:hypothetical protein